MAGAVDLFSGSNSITGANLFTVDKNPLAQLFEGIDDVIGKQAGNLGVNLVTGVLSYVQKIAGAIIDAILGLPLELLSSIEPALLESFQNVDKFFTNTLSFLGGLDPLSAAFSIETAAENFINDVLAETGLLPILSAGHLAESVLQPFIDAIAQGFGLATGLNFTSLQTALGAVSAIINAIEQFVAQWTAALAVTGVSTPTNFVELLRGLIPAAVPQFNGTAIATTVDGFVDNLNGTISYTIQEGQSEVSHLIQQADGTVVTAAVLAQHIASAATTAGVSAGQAVVTGIAGAANAQGVINSIHNVVNNTVTVVDQDVATVEAGLAGFFGGLHAGFTGGNIVSPPPASAADISAAAAALQQRLATIGNGGEELVDVEFSAYSNGAIPGIFTALSGNSGTAPTVSGGLLALTSSSGVQNYQYNGATTLTDYQQVTGIWPTQTGAGSPILLGRVGTGAYIFAEYKSGIGWRLSTLFVNFDVTFTDIFTPGATYSLLCGDPATNNLYKFTILKNGAPLPLASVTSGDTSQPPGQLYYIDTGHVSTVGGSTRSCGLGFEMLASGTVSMSSFLFQDTTQSSPAVLVTTSESTSSTTYTDLATISDDVAVTIGTSGLAQVNVSAQLGNNTVGALSCVSFAMSGANTQAAADNYSISVPANASDKTRLGAPFLLTGLSPGLTVFKMKYRAGSGTANFADRRIGVVAL